MTARGPSRPTSAISSFPARGRHGQNKVSIDVDGKPYLSVADTLITASDPDHWRFLDLKLMQGKTLSVKIEGPGAAAIELVKTSDTIPGKYPVYQEPGRPQVHFSPLRGSLNDPCGMIYYEGRWHLYYALKRFYNDNGAENSTWGHATSTDLLHWEEQPMFLPAVDGNIPSGPAGRRWTWKTPRVWASRASPRSSIPPTMAPTGRVLSPSASS